MILTNTTGRLLLAAGLVVAILLLVWRVGDTGRGVSHLSSRTADGRVRDRPGVRDIDGRTVETLSL